MKESLITFRQSPFLESVNNFELSTTELRQFKQSLCQAELVSVEHTNEKIDDAVFFGLVAVFVGLADDELDQP